MATCSPGEHIVLPRNSHISAISAMVLSGAIPKYIMPGYDCKWDIAGGVTPSQVSLLGLICFCISKAFLKQFEFYFIFFFASN
jgi:hypothetical protein